MNISNEPPGPPLNRLFNFEKADPQDEAFSNLQQKHARLIEQTLEERFCWIVVIIVLVDLDLFERMQTWAGPIVVLVLEAALLVVIARRLGVQEIIRVIDRIIDGWVSQINKSK